MRFKANENPYGTSPLVREAIPVMYHIMMLTIILMVNAIDLRMKLAAYWKVQPEQLVIGVGSG